MNWEYREKEMLSSVLRSQGIYPLHSMSGILKMPTKIPSLGKENILPQEKIKTTNVKHYFRINFGVLY